MECGILAIKKTSVETLQILLYSALIKHAYSTHTGKRRRKITSFYLKFSLIATLKKQR